MKNSKKRHRTLAAIAGDYFGYLGRNLPQQCASDEFYCLPRAEAALQHLDRLDDLTPERIQDHIRYVKSLLREIPSEEYHDVETEIDRCLLRQSMEGFLLEFDETEGWRIDPTLYVKIPLFATDLILSQSDRPRDLVATDLSALLSQIPPFLSSAVRNLRCPSEIAVHVAFDMVKDAFNFHKRDVQAFIAKRVDKDKELFAKNRAALNAWGRYQEGLRHLLSRKSFAIGEDSLKRILAVGLGYPRSPREILEIAQQGYQKTQEKIHEFARRIDSRKTWTRIIAEQLPPESTPAELLRLYQKEVKNLRRFFYSRDIMALPAGERVTVIQTPLYLQSLRAAASYRAPLTGNARGHGIFYVTPGDEDLELISIHCPYLSAHETYPGHHILDYLRIHHSNPIRRQIESPLFYEGWACYGEGLLDELGYVQAPAQQLVQLKRILWRSLRAMLDIELQTGQINLAQGAEKMKIFGFSSWRRQRQVRRYALTPGYQLCYFMGMYEIIQLRKQFEPRFGLRNFHDILLGGGEIPFHLVEKRLEIGGGGRNSDTGASGQRRRHLTKRRGHGLRGEKQVP